MRRTLREELAEEVRGRPHITIETRRGQYKLVYEEGSPLSYYLKRARIIHLVRYQAIYDQTNPEVGRVRNNYVPVAGAILLVGPAAYSPVVADCGQRKEDGVIVMGRMKTETGTMEYGSKPEKKEPVGPDGVEQW